MKLLVIKLSVLCLCLGLPGLAFGQGIPQDIFEPATWTAEDLAPKQAQRWEQLQKHEAYSTATPIRLGTIRSLQRGGALSFSLPDHPRKFVALPYQIDFQDDDNYTWRGSIDYGDHEGDLSLFAREGEFFGNLRLNGEAYEVRSLGKGVNVLLKTNEDHSQLSTCLGEDAHSQGALLGGGKEGLFAQERTETTCNRLRILVVYTPAAEALVDPTNYATAAISDANVILSRSAIGSGTLRFELAGVQPWNYVEQQRDVDGDVNVLINDPTIEGYRIQHEADVVVALTDGDYVQIDTAYYSNGVDYEISIRGIAGWAHADQIFNQDDAHALVEVTSGANRYTFVHEVAHLFGCRHEFDANGLQKAHGYHFRTGFLGLGDHRNTIMSVDDRGERIMNFSNPNVTFKDKPTGTHDYNDNAYIIRTYRQYLCNIYPDPEPFAVSISGPTSSNNSSTPTWCANITGCSTFISYTWQYSTDGFNFYPAGTTSCISQPMPFNSDLWLRLTASCSGEPFAKTQTIQVRNTDVFCRLCKFDSSLEESSMPKFEALTVYPNPSQGTFTVWLGAMDEGLKTITLVDIAGKTVYQQVTRLNTQLHVDQLPLRPGMYFLIAQGDQKSEKVRLVIK